MNKMGEAKRREIIFNSVGANGEAMVDFRALLPKPPDYRPRERWGWACFCVFNDKDAVIDMVTIKLDGSKGFSSVMGELDYAHLQVAKECWQELKACAFLKRVVNGALLN
jgi:hypothetical protein